MTVQAASARSLWAPLNRPVFRLLIGTNLVALLGWWMQDVAVAWLMTSLAPEPIMVSLLQTATYLPYFLLSLPGGALGDVINRRTILISAQIWLCAFALALGLLTLNGLMTSWLLLLLIFVLCLGGAIFGPAWNALTPELVQAQELESAVALTTAGSNLARGLGAALGGLVVAHAGAGWVFLLNAATIVALIVALYAWRPETVKATAPQEKMTGAMKAGVRYVRHSLPLKKIMIKTSFFAMCSTAIWALLPLLCREQMRLSPEQYGLCLSVFGVGNLAGGALFARLRQNTSVDRLFLLASLIWAGTAAGLAFSSHFSSGALLMLFMGISWTVINSCLTASVLVSTPSWVRARAMAVYFLVFQGCLAGGSLVWGCIAERSGMPCALIVSGALMLVTMMATGKVNLVSAEKLDMRSSRHWPQPNVLSEPHPDHGPVLITVEYLINPERAQDFRQALGELEAQRRRDGAVQWHLYCDLARNDRYCEMFMLESWGEYLRQRERATVSDRHAEEKVISFHVGGQPPQRFHMLAERRRG